jgi:integrative and conjugative element protein (TIGR02256 family)
MARPPGTPTRLPHLRTTMNASHIDARDDEAPDGSTHRITLPDVSISREALDAVAHEALRSRDGLETGGILLGHDYGQRIEIRHAGDPGPNASRGTHTFDRDLAHATALAEAAWISDRSQWLGEWHTHPNQQPAPSARDLNSYLQHVNDPDLDFDRFISIIVTEVEGAIAAVTWLIDNDSATAIPLRRST